MKCSRIWLVSMVIKVVRVDKRVHTHRDVYLWQQIYCTFYVRLQKFVDACTQHKTVKRLVGVRLFRGNFRSWLAIVVRRVCALVVLRTRLF